MVWNVEWQVRSPDPSYLDFLYALRKKADPHDQHMPVNFLHQKRSAYTIQLTKFRNESKYFSGVPAYVVNLPAYAGTRLVTKATFFCLVNLSDFQTSQ